MMQQTESAMYTPVAQSSNGYSVPYNPPEAGYSATPMPYQAHTPAPPYPGSFTDPYPPNYDANRVIGRPKSIKPVKKNLKSQFSLCGQPEEVKFGVILVTRNYDIKGLPNFGQYTFNPHIIKEWAGMSRWNEYSSYLYQDSDFEGHRIIRNARSVMIEPIKESIEGPEKMERGKAHLCWDDSRGGITLHSSTTIW